MQPCPKLNPTLASPCSPHATVDNDFQNWHDTGYARGPTRTHTGKHRCPLTYSGVTGIARLYLILFSDHVLIYNSLNSAVHNGFAHQNGAP